MTTTLAADARWRLVVAAAIFVAASAPDMPLNAQALKNQETIDRIIGSKVVEEEWRAEAVAGKIISAIDKTSENILTVRKLTKVGEVDIVFLPDAAPAEGGPPPEIEVKVRQYEPEIKQLRAEIEANTMLYHAIDSRRVLIRDVLAIAFSGEDSVAIYVAEKLPR